MTTRVRRSSRGRRWRHLKKALRAHPRRTAAGVAVAVLVLMGLWVGWRVFSVGQDFGGVQREATILRAALVRGDVEGANRALDRFQEEADSARSGTSGPTWTLLEHLPLLGDDARGLATVADVLSAVGHDGLEPVVGAAEQITANAFRPFNGRFPLEQISSVIAPAKESEAAFAQGAQRLDAVDSTSFVGPLRNQFTTLQTLVEDARATLSTTYRAARLMPSLMGQGRARHYLLVLQNNAELRSGGGLPGALSLVRMKDGKVDIVDQADMSDIANDEAVSAPLTREERRMFGDILGWAGVNATLTPDTSRSSEIIRSHWARAHDTALDGLIYIDPVAVSYLLTGVGPVAVPSYAPVTASTVVQAVENEIYRRSNDAEQHSDYQQAVVEAIFDAFSSGAGDPATSIRGLVSGVMEGRIRMHSFRAEDQAVIAGTEIAGEFSEEATARPDVGIYLNDAGPSKMQYYLDYDASVVSRSCLGGRQEIAGSIDFHSNTPPDVASLPRAITGAGVEGQRTTPGDQLLVVYVTSPVGGQIKELSIDGRQLSAPVIEQLRGRAVARVGLELSPQSRHSISFTMSSGPEQRADVHLSVTPGARPGSPNGDYRSACTAR